MIDEYTSSFSENYAAIYDSLHRQKPYAEEAALVLSRVEAAQGKRPSSVLDLACGTGLHAAAFRDAGLRVHANDRSPAMCEVARSRLGENVATSSLPMESLRAADIGGPFELVVGLYTALGYLSPVTLDEMFASLRDLLVPGGYFFADFWNASRMASEFSPRREKTVIDGDRRIRRVSTVTALPERESLEVCFDFEVRETGAPAGPRRFRETHRVRYDHPDDLRARLEFEGFEVIEMAPFLEAGPLESSWNFYLLACRGDAP